MSIPRTRPLGSSLGRSATRGTNDHESGALLARASPSALMPHGRLVIVDISAGSTSTMELRTLTRRACRYSASCG
jgi:hypothetical protein